MNNIFNTNRSTMMNNNNNNNTNFFNNNKKFDIYTQKKINERVLSSKNKNNKSMNNLLYNKCNSCFINKISIYCRF